MTAAPPPHIPVMLSEVIAQLDPQDGETSLTAPSAQAATPAPSWKPRLPKSSPSIAIRMRFPRGPAAMAEFGKRFLFRPGRYSGMSRPSPPSDGFSSVDGVVLDLGVSSIQIDEAERGFSFQSDGPLDMRMGQAATFAADVVNTLGEQELADDHLQLGEERRSRAIASAIVAPRNEQPFARTSELAQCVSRVFHGRKIDGRHPATRTFQALRIHVNDELGELARALLAAEKILKPGGRLVVTFHSLEDRIVKRFFTNRAGKKSRGSRHLPETPVKLSAPSFRFFTPVR